MVKRWLIVAAWLALTPVTAVAQEPSCCGNLQHILTALQREHIQPIFNDSLLSQRIYHEFFFLVDPDNLVLSKEDIATAQVHEYRLIKYLMANRAIFLTDASSLLHTRLAAYEQWLKNFLTKPLTYQASDRRADLFTPAFVPASALSQKRQHYFTEKVLAALHERGKLALTGEAFAQAEAQVRAALLKQETLRINTWMDKEKRIRLIQENFAKAMAHAFDPHSDYFTASDEASFKSSLSAQTLSFGFEIGENEVGELSIDEIIPGGAAWNSKKINEGDVLISVQTAGQLHDLSALTYEEVDNLLTSPDLQQASFTLRKADGSLVTLTLHKSKIEQSENTINSFILNGTKRIGYISLPAFYTNWDESLAAGCASDVAKELIKLKKEKIDALIIDLRYNGGGSLKEALDLAGIFINIGPLTLINSRQGGIESLKDANKGTIYDGPLAIMVNGFSASASEIFSATLQDYNRALIIGTPTFGKATGQRLISILEGKSALKVTCEKLYRLDGHSYQGQGVQPHITLPDITSVIPVREKNYRTTLPPDSIIKKTYYTPFPAFPVKLLQVGSQSRMQQSAAFAAMREFLQVMAQPAGLTPAAFQLHEQQIDTLHAQSRSKVVPVIQARTAMYDQTVLAMDDHWKKTNEELARELESSLYINEVCNILTEYLDLLTKK